MYRFNGNASSNITQYFIDIFCLLISYFISYFVAIHLTNLNVISQYAWIMLVFIPVWVFSMYSQGMYDMTTFKYYDRILRSILIASILSGVNTAAMVFFIKNQELSRIFFAVYILLSTLIVIVERFIYTYLSKRYFKNNAKKIVVVGTNIIADKFMRFIKKTDLKVNVVQYIKIGNDYENGFRELTDIKTYEYLNQLLKEEVIDEVVFTIPAMYIGDIEKYALMCEEMGITVSMVLELYDFKISQISLTNIGTLPMLTFHSVCLDRYQIVLKRIFDLIGALAGVAITAILSIVIIPMIKWDSKGPIFFTQNRVGVNGRIFKLYKFRSMVADAEEKKQDLMSKNQINGDLMFKIKSDPRTTKVGRFLRSSSIDELPQFINVLKGNMSLVGTRPPTLDEIPKYKNHHWRRISIKPGITGLWQISGRSNITDFEEVVKLDTQYIDKWSIWLDIKIMLKTVFVIFKKNGAV